jgi:hypothetical protein
MNRALLLLVLVSTFPRFACFAAPVAPADRAALTKAVDQLCSWSGMSRQRELRNIQRQKGSWVAYIATADLRVDAQLQRYILRFDADYRVRHFMPEHFYLGGTSVGEDTLKRGQLRQRIVKPVAALKQRLGWKSSVGPYVQRVGSNFVVTYETVTAEEQKRANYEYLDPYVSFLVTPKGTVFGGFWGA